MSGRKNKNRHRGHQRGQSNELLDELSSIRDLLGSEEIGDIPLLDQVAAAPEPARKTAPANHTSSEFHGGPSPLLHRPRPLPEPLDESELPILFSPVDEELPEDIQPELNESDLALLRPLQDLPSGDGLPAKERSATPAAYAGEQQQELFDAPAAPSPAENPFLPAHIRARLTGGRVPGPAAKETEHQEPAEAVSPAGPQATEAAAPQKSPREEAPREQESYPERPTTEPGTAAQPRETGARQAQHERALQRQQLIDRLVAKQLPELERQLRARIELMVDELESQR